MHDESVKRCPRCGETKPLDQFGIRRERKAGPSARAGHCRACVAERTAEWQKRNRERTREQGRETYARNRESILDRVRRARDTPEYRRKHRARAALQLAVKRGDIVRPAACQDCGSEGLIHAHHHDYDLPFDVEWLCALCHGRRHSKQAA